MFKLFRFIIEFIQTFLRTNPQISFTILKNTPDCIFAYRSGIIFVIHIMLELPGDGIISVQTIICTNPYPATIICAQRPDIVVIRAIFCRAIAFRVMIEFFFLGIKAIQSTNKCTYPNIPSIIFLYGTYVIRA